MQRPIAIVELRKKREKTIVSFLPVQKRINHVKNELIKKTKEIFKKEGSEVTGVRITFDKNLNIMEKVWIIVI